MKATATLNGVTIEIDGDSEECFRFFCAVSGVSGVKYEIKNQSFGSYAKLPVHLPSILCYANGCDKCGIPTPAYKKVCNPLARHYGNCGASDCPIICAHTDRSFDVTTKQGRSFYCNNCKEVIYV